MTGAPGFDCARCGEPLDPAPRLPGHTDGWETVHVPGVGYVHASCQPLPPIPA